MGREIRRDGPIITSNWWSSLLPRNHPNYANVPPSNTLRQMEEREFFHRIGEPLDETGSYRVARRAILIAHDYVRYNIFTGIDDYCNDITLDRINTAEEALVNRRSSPRLNTRRTTTSTISTTTTTLAETIAATIATVTTTTTATATTTITAATATTTTTVATATTTTTAATATTTTGGVTTRAKRRQQSTWSEAEELGEHFKGQAKGFFFFFFFTFFFFSLLLQPRQEDAHANHGQAQHRPHQHQQDLLGDDQDKAEDMLFLLMTLHLLMKIMS